MFGFLKNKLKEWVEKAKDNLKPEEVNEEKPAEETEVKKEKKKKSVQKENISQKKSKDKKEKTEKIEQEIRLTEEKPAKEIEILNKETEEKITDKKPKEKSEITLEKSVEQKSLLKKIFGIKSKEEKENEIKEKVEEIIKETKPIQKKDSIIEELKEKDSEKEKTFFEKLKSKFIYKITKEDFDKLFDDLEMLLLENNVAMEVTEDIKNILSKKLIGKEIKKEELENEIKKELKNTLNEFLIDPDDPIEAIKFKKEKPFVILFFGINGTGKTTSIAKIAHLIKNKGLKVALAAGDTFRAASIEQIEEHAKKIGIPLIKHDYGGDPSAVGYDAIKYAKAHSIDAVLIDTAGRMHTKTNLIAEMEKIVRVTNPDLKIFVAESIAGNDATEQAKTFHEAIEIDGSILSKADIDEKGGTIISISHITKKPIFYLGTGQKYEDLKLFNKEDYIKSLGL